jgi:uncharacterized membrane protein
MFDPTAILISIIVLCVMLILLLSAMLVLVNSADKKDALKKMFGAAAVVSLIGVIGGWING